MAVKDLVGLFESQVQVDHTGTTDSSIDRQSSRDNVAPTFPSSQPTRAPARFLRHPLLGVRDTPTGDSLSSIDGLPSSDAADQLTTTTNDLLTTSIPLDEKSTTFHDIDPPMNSGRHDFHAPRSAVQSEEGHIMRGTVPSNSLSSELLIKPMTEAFEMESLLPNGGFSTATYTPPGTLRSRSPFKPPPEGDLASIASTSTAVQERYTSRVVSAPLGPHAPIPATTIFARKAAPLFIPHLDEYLSTIPAPSFPASMPQDRRNGKEKDGSSGMFPPMDRLAATGKTLEDLEHNSRVAPGWRNRDTIFGVLVSAALGLTV